jgi:multidrug resistance protein, MATE family
MTFGVADTVFAGRHSGEALAALSVGSAIYISVNVGLIGVEQALLPGDAARHGLLDPPVPLPWSVSSF